MMDKNRYYVKDEEENKAINLANGMFNFKIDSKEYKEFKEKLINGELSTERFNNPIPVNLENYTVFERFLIYNLMHAKFTTEDLDKVKEIINEANELTKYGIEKKCLVFDLENVNSWFNLPPSTTSNEGKKIREIEQSWTDLLSDAVLPEKTADRSHLQVKKAKLS